MLAALAAIGVGTAALVHAALPANATGGLRPTTTTATAAMTPDGAGVTLSATVTLPSDAAASDGTPIGTLTFTDERSDVLGSVKVTTCTGRTCTAQDTIPVSAFAAMTDFVVANYSGNGRLGSSSDSVPVLYDHCTTGNACTSGEITDADTWVVATVPVGDSALVTLGGPALPCSIGAGDVINLATSGTFKSVQLSVVEAGRAYPPVDKSTADGPRGHSLYRCAASNLPFHGFSSGRAGYTHTASDFARYGIAPFAASGAYAGEHVGLLADCFFLVTHTVNGGACENTATRSVTAFDASYIVVKAVDGGVSHFAG